VEKQSILDLSGNHFTLEGERMQIFDDFVMIGEYSPSSSSLGF